jgi:hypothetical protein
MNYEVVVGGSLSQETKQNGDADLSLLISGDISLEMVSGEIASVESVVTIVDGLNATKPYAELSASDIVVKVNGEGNFESIAFSEVTDSTILWACLSNGKFVSAEWGSIKSSTHKADIELTHEVDGDLGLDHLVDGEGVEFFEAVTNPYEGAYEVTPSRQSQVLPTALKNLSQNIVVNPIPSNYGLITWNGSTLTVS